MSSKELRKTYSPSYFSVEDIIASQTRIPCTTQIAINKFGFLDPSQESADLAAGTQIELPIWAARVMSKQKRAFIGIKMPKYFSENYREVLTADPTVVDLNKMGPQFYQAGLQLCALPSEDAGMVSEVLPEVLQKRMMAMSDSYSLNRAIKSTDEMSSTSSGNTLRHHLMDPLEVQLYDDSKAASEQLEKWLRN